MLFFFAEIMESGHINLLKTDCLEERTTVCQETITLLIKELERCCENLESLNHSKLYLCKMDILTAQTEIKPAKVIYAFSAPASILVWKLLRLLPPLLIKWEWGTTNNFLYCSHGEMELIFNILLFFSFLNFLKYQLDKNKTKKLTNSNVTKIQNTL